MIVPKPQAEFSPLIDLLYLADQAEQEQFRGFRDLLAPDLTRAVETLRVTRSLGLSGNRLDALLNNITAAAARLKVEKNLTDWPFQHFWGNPYEPRHSKLLRYFLDPAEEHGSGSFLLQRFFQVLAGSDGGLAGHNFPADRCSVTDGIDYIDLLIKREHPDRRFAIIIENKINDAVHRDKQLTRYVTKLQGEFAASEIYVLYLPLHAHKDPDADDLKTLPAGVHYRKITFETHVLKWLNAVLLNASTEELPLEMRENLSHYRNLLTYLVNQRKTQRMNEHILKKLAEAETLPTLSEVEKLEAAVQSLKKCLESVQHGTFLLAIQAAIKTQAPAEFYLEEKPARKVTLSSRFDVSFAGSLNLCVPVNDAVLVSFGTAIFDYPKGEFWAGYVKAPGSSLEAQAECQAIVDVEAKACWKKSQSGDPYYRWGWNKDSLDGKAIPPEPTPQSIADLLLKMRGDFQAQERKMRKMRRRPS